jgi:hypothetical protein
MTVNTLKTHKKNLNAMDTQPGLGNHSLIQKRVNCEGEGGIEVQAT